MLWLVLSMSISYAFAMQNLTGHYEGLPSHSTCNIENLENNPGTVYIQHCFTGNAYGYSPTLELVQNGSLVCGTYFECGDLNCSKFYGGPIAGKIEKNQLFIYWADGHHMGGPAELSRYVILKNGLRDFDSKSKQPTFVARSKQLRNPSVITQCNPIFPKDVFITEQGELNVKGWPHEQIEFTKLAQKKYASSPRSYSISLTDKVNNVEWRDKRNTSNFIIRQLVVTNNSKRPWTISVDHPETCRDYLNDYYNKKKDLLNSTSATELVIESFQKIKLNSCNGSVWTFENAIACPAMQCLKGCKC
jgi:hypothetical protein